MIRHWVEAMDDHNPVYLDDAAARRAGFDGVIAPPTMLQAWVMRGHRATQELEAARAAGTATGDTPQDELMNLLDALGYTSVVATNCEQHYVRPLVPGDRVVVDRRPSSRSPRRRRPGSAPAGSSPTAWTSPTATATRWPPMRFRILKFRPRAESTTA